MVSIGFDAVKGWGGLSFTLKGVRPGLVHRITVSVVGRSGLHMLQDALGGLFVVLAEAPLPSILQAEHVLLVAVQHVTGMWVLRGMRMKAYIDAVMLEKRDTARWGGMQNAHNEAQLQAVGSLADGMPAPKARRRSATEVSVNKWARGMEASFMTSGKMWSVQSDGSAGMGMPQQQFISGGVFATALSAGAADRLREVQRELSEVDREITLVTPDGRNVPLSAQQGSRDAGAARLLGTSIADSPVVPPRQRTMEFSPSGQVVRSPPRPALEGEVLPVSVGACHSVPLGALTAGLPQRGVGPQGPAIQVSGVGDTELDRLMASRVLELAEMGVPNGCIVALSRVGVSAGNMADLPWEMLVELVSGSSEVGITILQKLHARLRQAREARSQRSDSRSNSRASSREGSRSGVSGIGAEAVLPPGAQPAAGEVQRQQVTAGPAAGDLGPRFAVAGVAGAPGGTACTGVAQEVLDPFAVEVRQPGSSPWMMQFPGQPSRLGLAAKPAEFESECVPDGWGNQRWVRRCDAPRGACCAEHGRPMASAGCGASGVDLGSPPMAAQAAGPLGQTMDWFRPHARQEAESVSPVACRSGEHPDAAGVALAGECALVECGRPRFREVDGRLHECCGVKHAMEMARRRDARETATTTQQQQLASVDGGAQAQQQRQQGRAQQGCWPAQVIPQQRHQSQQQQQQQWLPMGGLSQQPLQQPEQQGSPEAATSPSGQQPCGQQLPGRQHQPRQQWCQPGNCLFLYFPDK